MVRVTFQTASKLGAHEIELLDRRKETQRLKGCQIVVSEGQAQRSTPNAAMEGRLLGTNIDLHATPEVN